MGKFVAWRRQCRIAEEEETGKREAEEEICDVGGVVVVVGEEPEFGMD
jgi:hypothetical protein